MLSTVVRHGISTGDWNTIPTSVIGAVTGLPRTRISPEVAGISPDTSRQQRRLAAAARSDDGDELAIVDR
jgi:hypothetical protein